MNKHSIIALMVLALGLAACNTFEGVGQDIESAGEALSGSASKTKQEMSR